MFLDRYRLTLLPRLDGEIAELFYVGVGSSCSIRRLLQHSKIILDMFCGFDEELIHVNRANSAHIIRFSLI